MAGVVLSSFSTVHQYFHFFEHWQSIEEVRTEIEIFVYRCHFSRIVKIVSMVYDTHLVILCVPSGRDVKSVNMSSVTLERIYRIGGSSSRYGGDYGLCTSQIGEKGEYGQNSLFQPGSREDCFFTPYLLSLFVSEGSDALFS